MRRLLTLLMGLLAIAAISASAAAAPAGPTARSRSPGSTWTSAIRRSTWSTRTARASGSSRHRRKPASAPCGSRTAPILRPAGRRSAAAQRSSTPTTERSASSTRGTRGSSIHAAARRLTEGCSSARRSAMTAVRTHPHDPNPRWRWPHPDHLEPRRRRHPRGLVAEPKADRLPKDDGRRLGRRQHQWDRAEADHASGLRSEFLRQLVAAGKRDRLLATRDAGRAQLDLVVHTDGTGLHEINLQPTSLAAARTPSQRPGLQRTDVVARRDDDRVHEITQQRRRWGDLHR